jgi:ankyrin repeat protein
MSWIYGIGYSKIKIKDLIFYGIDVNAKDKEGWNALHRLCRYHSSSNLIGAIQIILTQSKIDVKAKGNDGSNALLYLVPYNPSSQLSGTMEFLIESGMDGFAKDNDGRSP